MVCHSWEWWWWWFADLSGGFGEGVVISKGLEEEAQFNIPVPSRRGPAQHISDYGR
jgi:hypothetical protein